VHSINLYNTGVGVETPFWVSRNQNRSGGCQGRGERGRLLLASLNLIECADVVVRHDNFGNTVSALNTHPWTPVTGTFAVPRKYGSAQDVYNLLAAWNP
jgi:hypothetical protein